MTAADLHPAIREAIAAQGIFTKIGFSADCVFIKPSRRTGSSPDRVDDLAVVVRREAEYTVYIGSCAMSFSDFRRAWTTATTWWNTLPQDERTEFVDTSDIRLRAVDMIAEMTLLGFDMSRGKDA